MSRLLYQCMLISLPRYLLPGFIYGILWNHGVHFTPNSSPQTPCGHRIIFFFICFAMVETAWYSVYTRKIAKPWLIVKDNEDQRIDSFWQLTTSKRANGVQNHGIIRLPSALHLFFFFQRCPGCDTRLRHHPGYPTNFRTRMTHHWSWFNTLSISAYRSVIDCTPDKGPGHPVWEITERLPKAVGEVMMMKKLTVRIKGWFKRIRGTTVSSAIAPVGSSIIALSGVSNRVCVVKAIYVYFWNARHHGPWLLEFYSILITVKVEVISNKSIFDNPNIKTACVRAQRKSPKCYQQLLSDKVGLRMNVSIYEDSFNGIGSQ
jgi:hypothetical protein